MSTVVEVKLWGSTIGAVSLGDNENIAAFEYSKDFAQSGIEVSPITMPLSRQIYRFPALARETFHGLPGLLSDSLPDKFGNALIDTWLARQGRSPNSFNAVERLAYTGKRGMGALEFVPAIGPEVRSSKKLEVSELVQLASEVLANRAAVVGSFSNSHIHSDLKQILQVGTSAGGARAKAVIAWNPQSNEVRSGQVHAPEGFEYWLLKFDGVTSNRDKEMFDPKGYGVIEYAYYLMAKAAGMTMQPCRLLEENNRRHFMTKRFDRMDNGQKKHMQTLGALAHFDFNMAGAYSYEQVFAMIKNLGLSLIDVEEQYRRMVFNILARNQDDHVKNITFLMNKRGAWSLAPAYDVTYSYDPQGNWTSSHQMTINGKRDGFVWDDFKMAAKVAGLKRGRAETIYNDVYAAISHWSEYASTAGLAEKVWTEISKNFRLNIKK